MLKTGLYEQIIDRTLAKALDEAQNDFIAETGIIDHLLHCEKLLTQPPIRISVKKQNQLRQTYHIS